MEKIVKNDGKGLVELLGLDEGTLKHEGNYYFRAARNDSRVEIYTEPTDETNDYIRVASNMSFALPEDFTLDLRMPGGGYHVLEFVSENEVVKGGIVYINIQFDNEELTAKERMEEFMANNELKVKGEFLPVTRGKGKALGAFYTGGRITFIYDERYDFPPNSLNQNQVSVTIQLTKLKGKKLGQTIYDVLELPSVKAFLDRIEYF